MDDRIKYIKPLIENKIVLDLGCCGYYQYLRENSAFELDGWLHNNLRKYAKNVIGIDLSEECVDFLQKKGYNIIKGDVENFDIDQKFDVIIAGEIIEHLSNFQGFFNSIKKHLNDDGILIITTPNVFYFRQIFFLLIRGHPSVNETHTCWFDEIVLKQLLVRFGFSIENIYYMTDRTGDCYISEEKWRLMKNIRSKTPLKRLILKFIEKMIWIKQLKYNTIIFICNKKNIL